jgi:hypothetical protein
MSNYLGTPVKSGINPLYLPARRKKLFDFAQEYSRKTASFCIRYENAKSDLGQHGAPRFQVLFRKGKVV